MICPPANPSRFKVFWVEFLQGLRARGLSGVELVISDAHLGLKGAISEVLVGSSWQRCRVHFMRNVLAKVPRSHGQVVAALIRTVFAQVDDTSVRNQFDAISDQLRPNFEAVSDMLDEAKEDLCAFATFPREHWTKTKVEQPARARQRRDQAPHESGRDLPERCVGASSHHRSVH